MSEKFHGQRNMLEVKVFDGKKKSIVDGFNRLLAYLDNYCQSIGCLLIFNTSKIDLSFAGELIDNPLNGFSINNKTIFIEVVNIWDTPSSSKRGKHSSVFFKRDVLIEHIENQPTE